jgi:hypothetical protein
MNEFLCKKMDSLTAWIGTIGIFLALFRWETGLLILFVLLIFLPESKFSDFFKKVSGEIKEKASHNH